MSTPAERSPRERIVALVTIIVPFLAVAYWAFDGWGATATTTELVVCFSFYCAGMLGITMGFHRLFTHRSFSAHPAVRAILVILGSMAAQGPLLFWVAIHRKHHQCSDQPGDPHSPHGFGQGGIGLWRGWLHSHIGWMFFRPAENYFRRTPDLIRDRVTYAVSSHYLVWCALGILLPGAITSCVRGTPGAFVSGAIWGGFIRIFLTQQTTWSINSICHLFGDSPFQTTDESRNNWICALLTMGEGWHNNHHAFPTSARHGLFWWQLDLVYILIRLLERAGLAHNITLPEAHAIERKTHVQPAQAGVLSRQPREGVSVPEVDVR